MTLYNSTYIGKGSHADKAKVMMQTSKSKFCTILIEIFSEKSAINLRPQQHGLLGEGGEEEYKQGSLGFFQYFCFIVLC